MKNELRVKIYQTAFGSEYVTGSTAFVYRGLLGDLKARIALRTTDEYIDFIGYCEEHFTKFREDWYTADDEKVIAMFLLKYSR